MMWYYLGTISAVFLAYLFGVYKGSHLERKMMHALSNGKSIMLGMDGMVDYFVVDQTTKSVIHKRGHVTIEDDVLLPGMSDTTH